MSTNGAPNNLPDLNLKLDSRVYSPSEDSFLLAGNLIISEKDEVLEIGIGSGYVSLIAAQNSKFVWGTDINPKAVQLAKENAKLNEIDNVEFLKANLFPSLDRKYDLILFNPPYLPEEELLNEKKDIDLSWSSGPDGRKITDKFIQSVSNHLKKEGKFQLIQSSITDINKTKTKLNELNYNFEVTANEKLFFEELVLITGFKT